MASMRFGSSLDPVGLDPVGLDRASPAGEAWTMATVVRPLARAGAGRAGGRLPALRLWWLLLTAPLLLLSLPVWAASPTTTAAAPTDSATSAANRQFIQAMQLIRKADGTYEAAEEGRLLREAERLLHDITTRFPDTDLAVQLVTNQFVGDFDYVEFQTRVKALVCNEPLSGRCFLFRITNLLPPVETPIAAARWDWLSLAVAYHLQGDPARAQEIIAPFLAAARRGTLSEETERDLFVSRALALTGQIPLALEVTRQISDCSTRIYNLADIATAALWQGQRPLAQELVAEAAGYATEHHCQWEQGVVCQALLAVGQTDQAQALFKALLERQAAARPPAAPTPAPPAATKALDKGAERKGTDKAGVSPGSAGRPAAGPPPATQLPAQLPEDEPAAGDCCAPELAAVAGELGEPAQALALLRDVQDENPWTVGAVLGRLARRGEVPLALAQADQVTDIDLRSEVYAELVDALLKHGNRPAAEEAMTRLARLVADAGGRRPSLLAQRARAEKVLYGDERWRKTFQQALASAENASSLIRRDIGGPLLAVLVRIETGWALLD